MYDRLKDNTWAADLAEVGSLFLKNQGVKYLSCVIVIFTKYAWVKSLKDTRAKTVLDGFIETVNKYKRKPNYELVKNENFTLVLRKNG